MGSTDVRDLICGGRLDVYLRKVRGETDNRGSSAARRGIALEEFAASEYARQIGATLVRPPMLQVIVHPWEMGSPDRFRLGAGGVWIPTDDGLVEVIGGVELKAPTSHTYWEWRGSDGPERYLIQSHWLQHVSGVHRWDLCANIDGDPVTFIVPWDDEIGDALAEIVSDFWHGHVLARVPPEPTTVD